MQESIEDLRKQFLLNDEEFKIYYNYALEKMISNKERVAQKKLIIVGGQSGAGKSRLIPVVEKELNNNAVVVDFDLLRSFHPNFQKVSEEYVEKTHTILHPDVEKVKNCILRYLREKGYDVIYEGSLRNTQGFIDFSEEFLQMGYDISLYIMAVPELESFGSTYARYAEDLKANNNPRWVEKIAHDESFLGVLRTVQTFEEQGLCKDTKVFIRGNDEPKEIYSTQGRQFYSTNEAIQYGREIGREKAVRDFWIKYKMVYEIFRTLKPELMEKLTDWEDLFTREYTEKILSTQKTR